MPTRFSDVQDPNLNKSWLRKNRFNLVDIEEKIYQEGKDQLTPEEEIFYVHHAKLPSDRDIIFEAGEYATDHLKKPMRWTQPQLEAFQEQDQDKAYQEWIRQRKAGLTTYDWGEDFQKMYKADKERESDYLRRRMFFKAVRKSEKWLEEDPLGLR